MAAKIMLLGAHRACGAIAKSRKRYIGDALSRPKYLSSPKNELSLLHQVLPHRVVVHEDKLPGILIIVIAAVKP